MIKSATGKSLHVSAKTSLVLLVLIICTIFYYGAHAQTTTIVDTTHKDSAVIIAGDEYARSGFHNWLWGKHYRKEWNTPVKVKSVNIDTLFGGLTPIKKGGGRQTKTLRLKDKEGHQYVLRSIDKTYTKALPEIFQGTMVEDVANDQVSVAHPYSAITIPMMAEAAGVYHTNPQIVFLPDNANLGEYREDFKDQLYLLEERADGFEGDADNFGNSEDVDGTEKMLRKIYEENDHRVDQEAFIRARLFDMFLSDWGRHEDQWRWATFKEDGVKIYRPIPRDRDQAYTRFDGLLVGLGTSMANLVYLQSVDYTIKNIKGYNFQARHLDRQLANEPSLDTWVRIAKELQQALTDDVIEKAMKALPPEVYKYSGPRLTDMLKSRRDELVQFARDYYKVLSKDVDVVGTENKEMFEVTGLNDSDVVVKIFDLNSEGQPKKKPYYNRTFHASETKEVRLYGESGHDQFVFKGTTSGKIEIRVIGGPKEDTYTVPEGFNGKVKLYDDQKNNFNVSGDTKLRISADTNIHKFDYYAFNPDFKGIKAGISYNNEDRLFVSLGYKYVHQQWRKKPYGFQSSINVNYSITQKAFSVGYQGLFNKIAGNWNLGINAVYDAVRDAQFLGVGNNTKIESDVVDYYRYRNHEVNLGATLWRQLGKHQTLSFTGFYNMVTLLSDNGRFLSKVYAPGYKELYTAQKFVGARADYLVSTVNDKLFPSKGVAFSTEAELTHNLTKANTPLLRLTGMFGFYVPIAPSLTLAIKTTAATLSGDAEFYQLNKLGGGRTMRGFLRYRFYGKTAVYNQNELQYNFNVRTFLFNGKMGIMALLDDGRVWMPGEVSDKWHVGYGGGIMIAPFNRMTFTGSISTSGETTRYSLRIGKLI